MPVIEQKIHAMLFELDRERGFFRDFLQDLYRGDADFIAAGRALLGPDFADDDDAGFLCEALQGFECGGVFLQRNDTLHDASSITEYGEEQLAGFSQVVEPAPQRNFLAVVFSRLLDGNRGHGSLRRLAAKPAVYQICPARPSP